MRYTGNKAVTRYRADYRPVNRYHGNKKVAGWKWSEQSGAILPFADTFNDRFLSAKIHGAIVQSGSGDPSPDNVRPFVEVRPQRVAMSGKNLIVYPYERPSGSVINGITYTVNADRSIATNGTAAGNSSYIMMGVPPNFIRLQKGTYTLSGCPAGGGATRYRVGIVTVIGGVYTLVAADNGNGVTFTITDDRAIYQIYCEVRVGYVASNLTFYPQLEIGTVATPYTPYTGDTIPLPDMGPIWGGGYRDYAAGVEYADKARATIAYATGWTFVTSNAAYARFQHSHPGAGGSPDTVNCWAENFTATSFYGAGGVESLSRACMSTMFASFSRVDLVVAKSTLPQWNDNWTSAEKQSALGTYIASHPISILYQLATPTTTHFTPITIPTVPRDTVISAEGAQVTARCRVVER